MRRGYTSWIAFFCSLTVYWLTTETGASLWDCPEYIDGALRLEIGHPPGNPMWLLTHRVISLFGFSPEYAVLAVNLAAGLFTAWAVGLLCSCTQIALGFMLPQRPRLVKAAALAGSLCFAWADSPWFSAVEAEVYAMSLWLTAICIRLALAWLDAGSPGRRWQYLILISYILGLSIGVHQLTMLVIPAVALIICYDRFRTQTTRGRQWLYPAAGCVIVAVILTGLMKGVPRILASAELFAVNSLALPYHSGVIAAWLFILALLAGSAFIISRFRHILVSGILWCLFFCCIGFSCYSLVIIRAAANPPMNQGNPSDIFSFISYIDRDQYGSAPLIKGPTPYSKPLKRERIVLSADGDTMRSYFGQFRTAGRPYYTRAVSGARISNISGLVSPAQELANDSLASLGRDVYILSGYKSSPKMIPELDMWFPRITNPMPDKIAAYGDWTGMSDSTMERVTISEGADSLGNPVPMRDNEGKPVVHTALRPTYMQNLSFLLGYQTGYMYFRYLLWNFAGRQNDFHSTGETEHGNFITGIRPVDNLMLGAEDRLPSYLGAGNPGRNRYFMIPFLLGLAGLIMLCFARRTGRRIAWTSLVLFIMTGLAIVVYLNQAPGEPRERDYAFLGSFWVFGFWISCGMALGAGFLLTRIPKEKRWFHRCVRSVIGLLMIALPLWMLIENYDDHDRSGRYPAEDYAALILGSLPDNTILFTTGDNHTFPLWYARNARGVRRDVTVVNTNYLQLPGEVMRLMRADELGQKVPFTMKAADIAYGRFSAVRVGRDSTAIDALEALRTLYADTSAVPVIPSCRLIIFGREAALFDIRERFGIGPGGIMNLKQLAMLDIVATNAVSETPRPVAWHHSLASKGYEGWESLTTPLPFALLWNPLGVGSESQSRERILSKRLKTDMSGYIDPVFGNLITWQRMALMTDTRRALETGDTVMARRMLKYIARELPFSAWGPDLKSFRGEVIDEAILFSDLVGESGASECRDIADSLRNVCAQRHKEFAVYYQGLPARLRRAVTPASRRQALTDTLTPVPK